METINTFKRDFMGIIRDFPKKVMHQSEAALRMKPSVNKWSKVEILGHLVDSALNNHQRWMRILQGEPITLNYNQDKWVSMQNYQHTPIEEVLDIWILINKQLYRILEGMVPVNLNLKYNTGQEEITLGYLIKDYLDHLKHHIAQIAAPDAS